MIKRKLQNNLLHDNYWTSSCNLQLPLKFSLMAHNITRYETVVEAWLGVRIHGILFGFDLSVAFKLLPSLPQHCDFFLHKNRAVWVTMCNCQSQLWHMNREKHTIVIDTCSSPDHQICIAPYILWIQRLQMPEGWGKIVLHTRLDCDMSTAAKLVSSYLSRTHQLQSSFSHSRSGWRSIPFPLEAFSSSSWGIPRRSQARRDI